MDPPTAMKKHVLAQTPFREHIVKAIGCHRSNLRSFLIDQELQEDSEYSRRETRLLLLGNQGSGRSTMVKQLRIHFGDGFPTSVRKSLIPFITANLSDAVVSVLSLLQTASVEIKDVYVKKLAARLIKSQPSDGYTGAVAFAYYTDNNTPESLGDDNEDSSCGNHDGTRRINGSLERINEKRPFEDEFTPPSSKFSNPLGNGENENPPVRSASKHYPILQQPANLLQSLEIQEMVGLLASQHPEVDWKDILESEVYAKKIIGVEQEEALGMWFENAFKKGKLDAGKVMAAAQERAQNPHLRRLPPAIAAVLPPPNHTPPTPPSKSAVDLDGNILTDTDEWSSTTSVGSNDRASLLEEVISLHLDHLNEDTSVAVNGVETCKNSSDKNGYQEVSQSTVPDDFTINPLSIDGKILKVIIDRQEFQNVLQQSSESRSCLSKSALYFIHNVDRFIQSDYVPALRDILLVQMPFTATRESIFQFGQTSLRLINVGDQRGDRRKWIHVFESVHSVLFFAALTDYSELSANQTYQTRLDESLAYFRFLLDAPPILKKEIIVFLTKKDLLPEMLASEESISPGNPEIDGSEMCAKFIYNQRELFLSQCQEHGQKSRRIFIHSACLLDIDEMKELCRVAIKEVFETNLRKYAFF